MITALKTSRPVSISYRPANDRDLLGASDIPVIAGAVRHEARRSGEHLSWHARYPQREVGVLGLVRWADELRVTPFMRWLERGVHFDFEWL